MRPVRLCVDVGANTGQTLLEFLSWWPEACCVSFEPLPEAWEELSRAVSSSDERAVAYPLAISDLSDERTLYASRVQPTYSSLRKLNRSADSVNSHRGLRETPSILEQEGGDYEVVVNVTTLDDHFTHTEGPEAQWLADGIDILKSDTQGCDLQVLRGARGTLRKTRVVLFEWQFDDAYGTPESLAEVDALLSESGFRLWDIAHIYKDLKNLRTLWVDLVYARPAAVR
jgi:FkbM family methyltransferase